MVIDAAGALVTPMMIESGLDPAAQLTAFFQAFQEKRAQDASTVTQALRALTVEAAARHGLSDRGRLIPTLRADFILWHARQLDDLSKGPARACFDSAWAAGIRLP
ncbi:hypothetical protein [Pseudoxanthomonas sp.]|uniref:hypothetical protein n=1 Tax=Pseudoxanthomonas sp. TaxID=1871049 RepID=UPI00263430C6|nr:hypothetical protein [Pseudoxanthomonas sp.]WDS35991.1 MAG: hypothetical protein O8I58_17070 [Pseudoxanthomonas sp.]